MVQTTLRGKRKIVSEFKDPDNFFKNNKKLIKHKRLRVFFKKGCRCINCGLKANRVYRLSHSDGTFHWGLFYSYKEYKMEMTIDHILAKSKGGKDGVYNLQPMCAQCNTLKGSKIV